MKTPSETQTVPTRAFSVESDRMMTVGAALLLVVCSLLLIKEIRHFIWGHLSMPASSHRGFWSAWDKVFEVIAALYCLIFAFEFPKKSAKLAGALMGIYLAGSLLLSWVQLSLSEQHFATVSRSVLLQIALIMSCVAIVDWFRSVVRRSSPSDAEGGDS
jgi:hypothetical protein